MDWCKLGTSGRMRCMSLLKAALTDDFPAVRDAACRAHGSLAFLPGNGGRAFVQPTTAVLLVATRDTHLTVRSRALWALANLFGVATGTSGRSHGPRAPLVIDDK